MKAIKSILAFGACVTGCVTLAGAQITEDHFEQHQIVIGSATLQTLLTGFFLGGAVADFAVLNIDQNGDRHLHIYAFEGDTWVPRLNAPLRPEVLFVDQANIGGRDRIIMYTPGSLNIFDAELATERVLVEIAIDYDATDQVNVPRVDITRDLNHDGRDDLVIPDIDGFWISTQLSDGLFTDAVKIGPAEPHLDQITLNSKLRYLDMGITAQTIPWYLSRVHEMDYDQDGRSDLLFWHEDHFDVHRQDQHGQFDPVAETLTVEVPFDSDGVYSLMFGYSDEGILSLLFGFNEKSTRKVLHSLRDINGDGVADLVTQTLEGRTIVRQSSLYEVHLGTPTAGGTSFNRDVDIAIRPQGKAGGMQASGYSSQWFRDFDGDGQVDVAFIDVKVGFGGMFRALAGNSVPIDIEFYRLEAGVSPDKPTATRKIRRFDPLDGPGNVFFPVVLMGDVNGDSHRDLLVGQSPQELHVFMGVPGSDILSRQPRKVAVNLPYDERNTWLVDLNKDRKQDIVIHNSSAEPARVTVLISK